MPDKVRPLKIESSALGGTQNDGFPTEVNPAQDYLAGKGIALEGNDSRLIDLSASGHIQFTDAIETSPVTVRNLRTAATNIFSNVGNGFVATNVQAAIEEARANSRTAFWCHYSANASTGRSMEFFPGVDMIEAPILMVDASKLITVILRAKASSTGTMSLFDRNVSTVTPVYSISLSASTQNIATSSFASPLASMSSNALLEWRVTSGSINKPNILFTVVPG